jgi:hypothetical protein
MKRKEMLERSLVIKNDIIERLNNELGLNFKYSYNSLYKVKGGEVRILGGGFLNDEIIKFYNIEDWSKYYDEYRDLFYKVKEWLENYNEKDFKIVFNYKMDFGLWEFKDGKNKGSFSDFRNEKTKFERRFILKIKWDNK